MAQQVLQTADDEEDSGLKTDEGFEDYVKRAEVDAKALQAAAQSKKDEVYGDIGGVLGGAAGAVGAFYTGNPMLAVTGYKLGKGLGKSVADKNAGEAVSSVSDVVPFTNKLSDAYKEYAKKKAAEDAAAKAKQAAKDKELSQVAEENAGEGAAEEASQAASSAEDLGSSATGAADILGGEAANAGMDAMSALAF
jgi:hypothetical protein